jgi:hypothetical protein
MNQKTALLTYLKRNRAGITQWTAALDLGILRLSERCRELEQDGHTIVRQWTESKPGRYGHPVRVMRYRLGGR